MKKFVSMVLVLFLMCCLALQVNAAETEKGSIEIKVEYNGTKISGGELIAVRVGDLDSNNLVFRRVTNRAEIKNIGESSAVTQMQNFYTANKNTYEFDIFKVKVKDGVAKFTDLPLGLYLVYQETPADGYKNLSAFLVTVPYEGQKDVTATAKTSLKKTPEPKDGSPTPSPSPSPSGNKKLPQTGQLTWPIPWMTLAGMVLFVFGWWLCFGKRKDSL